MTPERFSLSARWLLRLRWLAAAGQLATVAAVQWGLSVSLPLAPLLAVIGFTAATNVALELWLRRQPIADELPTRLLGAVMLVDLLSLTLLLGWAGGADNPFLVFYFVNLALAAVALPVSAAWLLTGVAVICVTGLLVWHTPLPELQSDTLEAVRLRQWGRFAALTACALVITTFITRLTRELRQREAQLRVAEQQRARSERLEALATLAAGAGHELASPLSTIAVVATELTSHLEGADVPPTVLQDVALIRSELDHCRAILDRMSGHAGQAAGEEVVEVTVPELVEEVLDGLRRRDRVEVDLPPAAAERRLSVPLDGLAQALRGVVQNALDASPDGQPVTVRVRLESAAVVLLVIDRGNGMAAEVLRRAGEPFFTTKETGQGMGLGLFLTRNVIDRLGGELQLDSQQGRGTQATIRLPG